VSFKFKEKYLLLVASVYMETSKILMKFNIGSSS